MNKKPIVLSIIYGVILLSVVTPLVLGASWNSQEEWTTGELVTTNPSTYINLDITPGATGGWVDGGYNFEASGFAFNASFQPLDNISQFTVVMWIKLGENGSDQYIVRETGGSNNDFKLYKQGGAERFNFHYGNGTDEEVVFGDTDFLYDKLYCVILTRGSATSDYGVMYHNDTKRVDTDVLTPPILAGGDLYLGYPGLTANVTFYSFNMYEFAIGDSLANLFFASGPDFIIGNESHYYTMNEGSGTVFYDHQSDLWHFQERWAGGIVESPITWKPVTDWGGSVWGYELTIDTPIPTFLDDMDSFLVLGGMGLLIMGGIISATVIKNDSSDPDSWRIALIGIIAACIGFALLWV